VTGLVERIEVLFTVREGTVNIQNINSRTSTKWYACSVNIDIDIRLEIHT